MRRTITMAALTAAAFSTPSFAQGATFAAPASEISLGGSRVITEISGGRGASGARIELRDDVALQSINWEEAFDAPCDFDVAGRAVDGSARRGEESRDGCPRIRGYAGATSHRSISVANARTQFVGGLQVCLNDRGRRLKGVRIRARTIDARGRVHEVSGFQEARLPNCNGAWGDWVECPSGHVATGLQLRLAARDRAPRPVTGLALTCRAVVATAPDTAYRFVGAPETLSGVSGSRGEEVVLAPGGGFARALDTIVFSERRDNPCFLAASGRDLNTAADREGARVNHCGQPRANAPSRREINLSSLPNGQAITGLRVCTNSRGTRVKGLEVEYRPIGSPDFLPETMTVEQSAQCAYPDNRRAWQRCGAGEVAVGLRAHFESAADPRSLTGLGLVCRAYR